MKSRRRLLTKRARSFLLFAIILTLTAMILIHTHPGHQRPVTILLVVGLIVRWFVTGRLHRRVSKRVEVYTEIIRRLSRNEPVEPVTNEPEEEFDQLAAAVNELIDKRR